MQWLQGYSQESFIGENLIPPQSAEQIMNTFISIRQCQEDGSALNFVLQRKVDARVLGLTFATNNQQPSEDVWTNYAYFLHPVARRHGLTTNVMKLAIQHVQKKQKLHGHYAYMHEDNVGSIGVAREAGLEEIDYAFLNSAEKQDGPLVPIPYYFFLKEGNVRTFASARKAFEQKFVVGTHEGKRLWQFQKPKKDAP